eukprot:c7341_g1_i1.p1 GENE.c7341_g1_i1~~c7341_g1_i1.p1  ORF type:complete len:375 (+),score=101.00 c7341_g1_i1:52-1176(+)
MEKQGVGHKLKMARHKLMVMVNKESVLGDESYDQIEEKFKKHVHNAKRLNEEMKAYLVAMRKVGTASESFGDVMGTYFRTAESKTPAKAGDVFQNALNRIGLRVAQTLDTQLDKVQQDWEKYCTFLDNLESKIIERKQHLDQFDYYKKKVQQLKEKPPKDPSKLPSNELKLENAQSNFAAINDELKTVFTVVCSDAVNALSPQMHILAPTLADMFGNMSVAANELKLLTDESANYGVPLAEPKYIGLLDKYTGPAAEVPMSARSTSVATPRTGSIRVNESPAAVGTGKGHKLGSDDEGDLQVYQPDLPLPPSTSVQSNQKKVKAVFDFEGQHEDELSFRDGDVLTVVEESEEGWWKAELNGKQGMIPFNYVRPL